MGSEGLIVKVIQVTQTVPYRSATAMRLLSLTMRLSQHWSPMTSPWFLTAATKTESDDEALLPEEVMPAHELVTAARAQQAAWSHENGGEPEDVPHQDTLRTSLLHLSKTTNRQA